MNSHQSPTEGLEALPMGAKVSIEIEEIPPIPSKIREMEEANMRQYAKDAWTTAWTLRNTLQLWLCFRAFLELKITIDDSTQEKIARQFPQLGKFQSVLSDCADLKTQETETEPATHRSQSAHYDFVDLCHAFKNVIGQSATALCKIGVHSQEFAQSPDEMGKCFAEIYPECDLSGAFPKFVDGRKSLIETIRLKGVVCALNKLLETAPATAVRLPKEVESTVEERNKHSADFVSVLWEGVSYTFSPGQQAKIIRLLWEAWENDTPALSEKEIGIAIEVDNNNFQLAKVFRKKKPKGGYQPHPALRTMIQRAGNGTYQLVPRKERGKSGES